LTPLIGISTDLAPKEGGWYNRLDWRYANAIFKFGGTPALLPIIDADAVSETVGRLDGILLSGGDDIHPRYYGEDISAPVELSPDIKTDYDLALLKEAIEQGKPVLGICLGAQEINVFFGGSLHQDMQGHKDAGGPVFHDIKTSGGRLAEVMAAGTITVNSYHHQSIKELGWGLICSGRADDGTVEAVELPGDIFVVGVQWHPERMLDDPHAARLFNAFISAAGFSATMRP